MGSVELQTECLPGAHKELVSDAFNRTFNVKISTLASTYSFCLVKSGETSFSVERFAFRNKHNGLDPLRRSTDPMG